MTVDLQLQLVSKLPSLLHSLDKLLHRLPLLHQGLPGQDVQRLVLGLLPVDLVLPEQLLDEPLRPPLALVRRGGQLGVDVGQERVHVGLGVELLGCLHLQLTFVKQFPT